MTPETTGDDRPPEPRAKRGPPPPPSEEREQNILPLSVQGAKIGAAAAVAVVILVTAVVWWRGDARALLFGLGMLVLMPPVGALLGAIIGGMRWLRR